MCREVCKRLINGTMGITIEHYNPGFNNLVSSLPHKAFFKHAQTHLAVRAQGEYIIVAGSYGLWSYLQSSGQFDGDHHHAFVPGDIDFYINTGNPCIVWFIILTFCLSWSVYEVDSMNMRSEPWKYNMTHIACIVEFQLKRRGSVDKENIQIMIWKTNTLIVNQEHLAKDVISKFDISICKVALIDGTKPNKFYFETESDMNDADTRSFEVRVKEKYENTVVLFARISKYTKRGFVLKSILFADGCINGTLQVIRNADASGHTEA